MFKLEDLTQSIYSVVVDGIKFYCRGLTYLEYVNLVDLINPKNVIGSAIWMRVAYCGIVHWGEFYDNDNRPIPFDPKNFERIDPKTLDKVGRAIYQELTIVTDDDELKYRGYIRFANFLSDEKLGEARRKSFDCKECVRNGHYTYRTCSLPELDSLIAEIRGPKIVEDEAKKKKGSSKYSTKKKRFSTVDEFKEDLEKKAFSDGKNKVVIGNLVYPQCPVSYIDTKTTLIANALHHCVTHNKSPLSGGVFEQPYRLFKLQEVVSSESNKIQSEEIKAKQK